MHMCKLPTHTAYANCESGGTGLLEYVAPKGDTQVAESKSHER